MQRNYGQQPMAPAVGYQGIQKPGSYHPQRINPQPGYQTGPINPMMNAPQGQYLSQGHQGSGRTGQLSR